ncbi:hypothetical protein M408DRAFT_80251 [Serendipita vermifera MAFF 305830]|uniref:Uncharacterized protein n=1 Tax=Serendipita vermifera MAFF 305830 TaxID=933852 RepID=A0A0C2WWB7_SERVB|nr:hypothetical protein M408DRAFT_80251 [Serendipita vermifera MAFF 305830]
MQSAHSEGSPIPASIELRDVASCNDQNSQRSIWGIVWSCLSTIFLCTWVAVHPNVHFRTKKPSWNWFGRWLRDPLSVFFTYKLPLFLWELVVPEYILAWAVRQYVQAGVVSRQVPGWTRTHGFFMIMGGFHLFRLPADALSIPLPLTSSKSSDFIIPSGRHSRRDEVPVCPLKFEDLPVDILEIIVPIEDELKDRGKSDALTKLIVMIQTLWFIVQCIARGTQRLPLTELEVVTLAYAMLNFFIYGIWWDKPQNVECPIRVYKSSTAGHKESGKVEVWEHNWAWRWMQKVTTYTTGAQDLYVSMSKRRSVPMFWSGRIESNLLGQAGLGPSILGAAFGAIHCVAWASDFPSRPEFVLWRISCVAMITVPLVVTMLCFSVRMLVATAESPDPVWVEAMMVTSITLLALSAWLYIVSRIVMLVIAFTSLRSLSPAAFMTVDWTTFIPHI